MSILGVSLGSHSVYVAVYNSETSSAEVLCDELGFRSIPSCVAFRHGAGDSHSAAENSFEVLVGQSAKQQQDKNPTNTFVDLRGLIFNVNLESVFVPVLNKEISTQELLSHLFKHVANQVKQQSVAKGQFTKDCFFCLPGSIESLELDVVKTRLIESAKRGGLRIRGFCTESAAPLIALSLDKLSDPLKIGVVVDFGWSCTSISIYRISNGLFSQIYSVSDKKVNAKSFNDACVQFCVKDFLRRGKVDCSDSKRSITRLASQCEQGIKVLTTSQETTIVIDSLFEGIDYSAKISRSRLEDLCSATTLAFRNCLNASLEDARLDPALVSYVVVAGGGGSQPFIQSLVRGLFRNAVFPKTRYESVELSCVGTCVHGGCVFAKDPSFDISVPKFNFISEDIIVTESTDSSIGDRVTILPSGTVLPAVREVTFQAVAGSTVFKFCVFRVGLSREYEIMGDVSFDLSSLHCTTEATFVLRFAADDESKSLVISLLPSSTQNVGPIILCCIPLPTAHEVAN